MKMRVETEKGEYLLELSGHSGPITYKLGGQPENEGNILGEEITPGVFSILLGHRSFTVRVASREGWIEAWLNGKCFRFRVSDPRDRAGAAPNVSAAGPQEVRALMPGKVVKLLVQEGDGVSSGAGVIVVEAMKMQNEMKSPKDGRVARIHVAEGATVGPGEALLVIE